VVSARGTSNKNVSGNAEDRRRRKQWLLDVFGDGATVWCAIKSGPWCEGLLTFATVTADRILPGWQGGTYRRENLQPGCQSCQSRQQKGTGQWK
jgi:hypothetical protein